jgi:phage gpG-like protein
MGKINNTPDFIGMASTLKKDLVTYAAVEGVNFFQDSIYNQGWTDEAFEPYEARKSDVDPGRKILMNTAFLLNSIQVFDKNEQRIVFGSDAEYAAIHNDGGTVKIPITTKSRRYFWLMFKVTENTMWKALALTKKQSITITIPKRQFIGESATFMGQLNDWVIKQIIKRFKQL